MEKDPHKNENEENYHWVLARLSRRGLSGARLAEICECSVPTIHRNLRNKVKRGRVKTRLCELLEPEELRKLGWDSDSLLDQLKGIVNRLDQHYENLLARVRKLERKK